MRNDQAVIEEFDVDSLNLSLRTTFRTHWKALRRHATVRVRISAGGIRGEGEAYTMDPEGVQALLGEQELLGRNPWEIESITQGIPEPAARSAVDLALHDLLGKTCGLPVYRLLGLPRARRPTCISIGIDEQERMIASAREQIDRGYPILKIKLTTQTDLGVIGEIRRLGGPRLRIWVDANQAYEPREAIDAARALASFGVEIFEQPLAVGRIKDYAAIRSRIALPILLDEEIRGAEDVAAAAAAGGIDGVNVKLAKLGGIRESVRAIHVARAHGMGVLIGCYFESSLGIAASSHLIALADRVDLDAPLFLDGDPYSGLEFEGAQIVPPDRPGIGVEQRAKSVP